MSTDAHRLDSIEELRVFVQVVQSGSIAAAAKVLRLPPLTVGRRLQALEQRLDRRLLNRSTRNQSLSEAGRAFLDHALRILDEVDGAEAFLDSERTGIAGNVAIGVVSALARDTLKALQPLLRDHPGLRLQLRVVDQHVNPVAMGLDVVFMGGRLPDSTLVARRLLSVHPVLSAHERYLERRGMPRTLDDLRDHEALLYAADPPRTAWVLRDAQGQSHRVPVRGRLEVDASTTMADALVLGLGIGMITRRFVASTPGMHVVLPAYGFGSGPLYAVFPHGEARSARIEAVVNAVQHYLRGQQTWIPSESDAETV